MELHRNILLTIIGACAIFIALTLQDISQTLKDWHGTPIREHFLHYQIDVESNGTLVIPEGINDEIQ